MATGNLLDQLTHMTPEGGNGIIVRKPLSVYDVHLQSTGAALTTTLTTNPGYDKVSTNLTALSWAAGVVVEAGLHLLVPTDYDKTLDELKLRLRARMAGATDTPSIDAKVWKDSAATTDLNPTKTAALGASLAWVELDLSGKSLSYGEGLQFALFPEAHGTDAVEVLAMELEYRSMVVANDEVNRS